MPITTDLQLTAKFTIGWIFKNVLDVGTANKPPTHQDQLLYEFSFTNGTGVNQADEIWVDRRTVTPSTPTDDIDLSGTALQNSFGRDLNLSVVKGFWIINKG